MKTILRWFLRLGGGFLCFVSVLCIPVVLTADGLS